MGQSITLKIAGRDYSVMSPSPEHEQAMRLAAESINENLVQFDQKYPNRDLADKLVFITLNSAVRRVVSLQKEKKIDAEIAELKNELADYLDKVDDTGSSAR